MGQIAVSQSVHERIALLARAWQVDEETVISRLLSNFQGEVGGTKADLDGTHGIGVHAVYQGVRTDATYDPRSKRVLIKTGPLASQPPMTPSGAAVAIVHQTNPRVRPERNGWTFWTISETGETLQTIRWRSPEGL